MQLGALFWSIEYWSGLIGIPLGISGGMLCRVMVNLRRGNRLRLYASLWEWARLQDDGSSPSIHARRIQRYYRQLRRYQRPLRHLSWVALGFGLALLLFSVSLMLGTCPLFRSDTWFVCGATALLSAALTLVWAPLALLPAVGGLGASLFLLIVSGGAN
jgi:hypothetical protein